MLEGQAENVVNRICTGECDIQKTFGYKKCSVSGNNQSSSEPALPKPADFQREMSPMPGPSTM